MQKIESPFLEAVKLTLGDRYTENMDHIYKLTIKFVIETVVKGYEIAAEREVAENVKHLNSMSSRPVVVGEESSATTSEQPSSAGAFMSVPADAGGNEEGCPVHLSEVSMNFGSCPQGPKGSYGY